MHKPKKLLRAARFELRRKDLSKIVGIQPSPLGIVAISKLLPPEPATLETWVEAAKTGNLKVLAQQGAVTIAGHQIDKVRAEFMPTVNLVATRQHGHSTSYNTGRENTTQVGINLSMNLFEGGSSAAQYQQVLALRDKARHELGPTCAMQKSKRARLFFEINNEIAQIQALEKAVQSAEISLQGMEAGQKAGLRTNSDVLNAQQQLYAARRDLQKERYGYLINRLLLQSTVGNLTDEEIESIETLTKPADPQKQATKTN